MTPGPVEWPQKLTPERPIAYFCMEFGLHESLPIYAGGLGVLAGDHLKSASDLGVPMVGVGLLYRQGYCRQRSQPQRLAGKLLHRQRLSNHAHGTGAGRVGQPVTIKVKIRQRIVRVQVWKVQVGRVELYLMDTDRSDNDPVDRWLTGHLYGGNRNTRIAQEVLLGIGGVRMLHALEIEPAIYHLNEGHAAFALLEVARLEMGYGGETFL
jgi:starch phosphorylase